MIFAQTALIRAGGNGEETHMAASSEAARAGITMGSALAITISWSVNKSILWAMIHGVFSWFYVIYYALKR